MDTFEKTRVIAYLRPNAAFVLRGDDIEWLDTEQKQPTDKEIADDLVAYNAAKEAEEAAALAKRNEILERLGITADEAKLLLA